jgi:hypothetical protein
MSLYATRISQLTTSDLKQLLEARAVENARLEFKSEVPTKDETLKKLSSFANTFGGFMVIGAKADSSDGRIQDLPGVDVEPGCKQKVVQWCFDGASPPLVVEVSDPIVTPAANGKLCYAIYVAESDVAPHFLNGRKGTWVRTDEFSVRFEARLADEHELRHLLDRRKLVRERRAYILERAKKRFDTYVARKHEDRSGHTAGLGPILEFCVLPRFPARQPCRQEELRTYIQKTWMSWRGVLFPETRNAVLSQHESAIVLDVATGTSIFEVNVWGLLFYAARIAGDRNGAFGVHLHEFVGHVLLFLEHSGRMLQMLGYTGPLLIETAIGPIRGVPWLYVLNRSFGLSATPGSQLDDELAFSISTTSEELVEKRDAVAMEVLRYILFSVNSPNLVGAQQKLENLIQMGCEYNS